MADSEQRWADEDADKAEGKRAAKNSEQNKQERHVATLADEPRFHEIIDGSDANAPNDHENSPTGRALME